MEPDRDPFGPHVCGHELNIHGDRCMLAPGHPGKCPKHQPRDRVAVRLLGGTPPPGFVAHDGEWSITIARDAIQGLVELTGATLLAVLAPPRPDSE